MAIRIGRRKFIAALSGATVALPRAARAQQPALPVIGVLRAGSANHDPHLQAAFRQGLGATGFIENQNVMVEYRWAQGRNDILPELLNDLVRRQVNVIAVPGSTIAALAAKAATQTIPVVFMMGADPVEFGLVNSFARPGGNLTGIAQLMVPVVAKRLEILHQLVPESHSIALLTNPTNPFGEAEAKVVQTAAHALGVEISVHQAKRADEIDTVFGALVAQGIGAVLLGADAFFLLQGDQIAVLAARHGLPAISNYREFPTAGGLMSYGNNVAEAFRLTGIYVGRILKGEKAADLPVVQPTKFEFVINLKTAKTLGLTVPPNLLALADEVIE